MTNSAPLNPALKPGDRLGKFQIRETLGIGGMGIVYRARDTMLDRNVAIKVLSISEQRPDDLKRFVREALAISAVEHPNVVRVFEYGVQGRPFIVMEYLRGEDLVTLLRRGDIEIAPAVDIILGVCAGVFACHRRGIIHRDLKPANIFIHKSEMGDVVKVLDFGVSRSPVPSDLTANGVLIGTLRYMSPEQASGQVADAKSDQYAIGLLLYALLTGKHPFHRLKGNPLLIAIAKGEVDRPQAHRSDIPDELDEIVATTMNLDPARRFASVHELARRLLPFATDRGRGRFTEHFDNTGEPSGIELHRSSTFEAAPTHAAGSTEIGVPVIEAPTIVDMHVQPTVRQEDGVTMVGTAEVVPTDDDMPTLVSPPPVDMTVRPALPMPADLSALTATIARGEQLRASSSGRALASVGLVAVVISAISVVCRGTSDGQAGAFTVVDLSPRVEPAGPPDADAPGAVPLFPEPGRGTGFPPKVVAFAVPDAAMSMVIAAATPAPAQLLASPSDMSAEPPSPSSCAPRLHGRKPRKIAFTEDGSPILD